MAGLTGERTPMIAANWKMHKTHLEAIQAVQKLSYLLDRDDAERMEVVICPPFTALRSVQTLIDSDRLPVRPGRPGRPPRGRGRVHRRGLRADAGGARRRLRDRRSLRAPPALRRGRRDGQPEGEGRDPPRDGRRSSAWGRPSRSGSRAGPRRRSTEQVRRAFDGIDPRRPPPGRRGLRADLGDRHGPQRGADRRGAGRGGDPGHARGPRSPRRSRRRVRVLYGGSVKPGNIREFMAHPEIDGALVGGREPRSGEPRPDRAVPVKRFRFLAPQSRCEGAAPGVAGLRVPSTSLVSRSGHESIRHGHRRNPGGTARACRARRPGGCRAVGRDAGLDHRQEPLGDLLEPLPPGPVRARGCGDHHLDDPDGGLRPARRRAGPDTTRTRSTSRRSTSSASRPHPRGGPDPRRRLPAKYLLGVDDTGRDLFVRIAYGARTSLTVAFFATGIAVVIGVLLGLSSGFYRGKIDTVISRATDVVLALPILLLALGHRLRVRREPGGVLLGLHQTRAAAGDLDHRAVRMALHRPHRPRAGPVDPREGVRRGLALPGSLEPAHHPPGGPPERDRADHRLHHAHHPEQHPVRSRALVPRRGGPGRHTRRGERCSPMPERRSDGLPG